MQQGRCDNVYTAECWSAFKKGDEKAFVTLHDLFFHALYDYALRMLQDPDLSYDAIQELFLKLWEKRNSLPEVQFVKAYLMRCLRSAILNKLRSLKLYELKIAARYHTPDIEFSPEEIRIEKESASFNSSQLTQMINTLPAHQKEIIYLRFYEGLSYKDISRILNVNYQSLVNSLNRILSRFKAVLKDHPGFFGMLLAFPFTL
jgi:RNA polymerase sigma-70 factor (ECF subfamily)